MLQQNYRQDSEAGKHDKEWKMGMSKKLISKNISKNNIKHLRINHNKSRVILYGIEFSHNQRNNNIRKICGKHNFTS